MRPLIRHLLTRFYRPWLQRYLRRDRRYRVDGLDLLIRGGVFHPGFFGSSRALLHFMKGIDMKGRRVLDLGCGSGLLALAAARRGAEVWAVDISPLAVDTTRENARRNGLSPTVRQSDLFEALAEQTFDLLLINPPYFNRRPQNAAEHAWYCGPDFDYYHRLFAALSAHLAPEGRALIILSEVCDLARIREIAGQQGVALTPVAEYRRWWEWFFLFEVGNNTGQKGPVPAGE